MTGRIPLTVQRWNRLMREKKLEELSYRANRAWVQAVERMTQL